MIVRSKAFRSKPIHRLQLGVRHVEASLFIDCRSKPIHRLQLGVRHLEVSLCIATVRSKACRSKPIHRV